MDLHLRYHAAESDLPPWGARQIAIATGIAIVFLMLILSITTPIAARMKADTTPFLLTGLMGSLCFELVLLLVAVVYTAGAYTGGIALLGWRPRRPGAWLGWALAALGIAYLALFAYIAVTQVPALHWARPQQNVPDDLFHNRVTLVPAIVLTVVVAPICEESFFRGFVFNGLRRQLGTPLAATISGVLFALAHFSPSLIVPFTIIGVGFAYAYRYTGTLLANVTAHAVFNLISVLATLAGAGIWLNLASR
jgi:membrane protease YdiL (CAAX protease family)